MGRWSMDKINELHDDEGGKQDMRRATCSEGAIRAYLCAAQRARIDRAFATRGAIEQSILGTVCIHVRNDGEHERA